MEEFTWLRTIHANKQITLTLSLRNPNATKDTYESQCTKFDQIRPVIASTNPTSDYNNNYYYNLNIILGCHIPTILYFTHSVEKLSCPKAVLERFTPTNPHHAQWKEAVFEQYDKNSTYQFFTKPIPVSDLPPNVSILQSVLAPSIKTTDIPSIWKLGLRHCINGKPLKGNEQYDPTFALTVSPLFFLFSIMLFRCT